MTTQVQEVRRLRDLVARLPESNPSVLLCGLDLADEECDKAQRCLKRAHEQRREAIASLRAEIRDSWSLAERKEAGELKPAETAVRS